MNTMFIALTGLILIATILGFVRVLRGPHALDRVLAFDYLSFVGLATIGLVFAWTQNPIVLDIALCLALVGFLSALIFSKNIAEEQEK